VPVISVLTPTENQQFLDTASVEVTIDISETDWVTNNGGSYRYTLDASAPVIDTSSDGINLGMLSIGSHALVLELLDSDSNLVGAAVTRSFNVRSADSDTGDVGTPALIVITEPVVTSSYLGGRVGANAVDDDLGSRWESEFSDPQFIQLDLGESTLVTRVVLDWEAAYGRGYSIDISEDATTWTTIYSTTTGDGDIDDIELNAQQGRYIRMYGTERSTAYGFSLYDFDVYGLSADTNLVRINAVSPAVGDTFSDVETISLQVGLNDDTWLANGGSYHYYLDNNDAVRAYSLDAIDIGPLTGGQHTILLSLVDSDGADVGLTESVTFSVNCGDNCPNVLVFTKTTGFRHGSIPAGIAMVESFEESFGWNVTATEDSTLFTTENLAQYSTIVFLNTTGDILDVNQKAAFRGYIEGGGGYVGTHSAADTEHDWDWYTEQDDHRDGEPTATVVIEVTDDPIMNHIGETWVISDEWYFWYDDGPGIRTTEGLVVLASLDHSSYNGQMEDDYDHPIIFKNTVGQGRAFYSALGHGTARYSNANMVEMIRKAIQWTSGN
jgi:type 1 glutamine amidotransferase